MAPTMKHAFVCFAALMTSGMTSGCGEDGLPQSPHPSVTAASGSTAELRFPISVDLAPGAGEQISSSGVLVTLTPVAGLAGGPPGGSLRGWVRPDGTWIGPSLTRGRYQVEALAHGRVVDAPEVLDFSAPNRRPPLRLDVREHGRVIVRIVDTESRLPVTDAAVTLRAASCPTCKPQSPRLEAGHFIFEEVLAGDHYLAAASHRHLGRMPERIAVTQATTVIERRVEPGTVATGQVRSASGPLVGARVIVAGDHGVDRVDAVTDGEGRFELSPIRPRDYHRLVLASGYAPHYAKTWAVGDDGQTAAEPIVMEPGITVFGRVTDDEGMPLAGIEVVAEPTGAPMMGLRARTTVTDDHGDYRFDDLADVRQVLAFGPADHPVHHVVSEPGRAERTHGIVQLSPDALETRAVDAGEVGPAKPAKPASVAGSVRGIVAGGETWVPEGTKIVLRRANQRMTAPVIEGRFDLTAIQPGSYEVSVQLFDARSPWVRLDLHPGEPRTGMVLDPPELTFAAP